MKKKSEFRKNLQKVIDRGLSEDIVLSALTTQPAEALGMQKSLGKIAPGYDANLVVVDGEYFDPKSKIVSVWIEGEEHYIASKKTPTFLGTWSLKYSGSSYDLIIEDPLKTQSTEKQKEFYKAYLNICLLYTSPSPRDGLLSRMPSSA